MTQVAIINFVDLDSGDDARAFVRVVGELIGLGLSLKKNGDIDVSFGPKELDQLIDALQRARLIVEKSKS